MRNLVYVLAFVFLGMICACAPQVPAAPAASPVVDKKIGALPVDKGRYFNGSGNCALCHTNMLDQGGADVSVDRHWRATMLANAAYDPYWQATVRSEITEASHLSQAIQKKCSTCHMPMAEYTTAAAGEAPLILEYGFTETDHPLHNLAMDGVSCTVCHQVEDANFGEKASFSGGFQVNAEPAQGQRSAYGPYLTQPNLTPIMQGASGFSPIETSHLAKAEMCGTCHNLYTPYLDDQGQIAGEFPEQMIYSEWANSAYRDSNCQTCHMPQAQGGVQLSTTAGPKRSPFFLHTFVGGNAFMGRMLGQNAVTLGLTAEAAQFETIAGLAQQQIEQQTAALTLEQIAIQQNRLTAQIVVDSLVGHKFPAGFPSRRAWLHITVLDSAGQIVFESGAVQADGSIPDNDNDNDPGKFEPHYTLLTTPGEVQIYEAIMLDVNGQVTTNLLRGAAYGKDNRLLPAGFDLKTASADIAVYGVENDPDFAPGQDRLGLDIDLGAAQGPFTVQVELLYQTIAYRWAANIMDQETAEAQRFAGFYRTASNLPLAAARVEGKVTR